MRSDLAQQRDLTEVLAGPELAHDAPRLHLDRAVGDDVEARADLYDRVVDPPSAETAPSGGL